MTAILGLLGFLALAAGIFGMLVLPALAGVQAGMIAICGSVLIAGAHVAETVRDNTRVLRDVTRDVTDEKR